MKRIRNIQLSYSPIHSDMLRRHINCRIIIIIIIIHILLHNGIQGSHYILVLKFKNFSRTLKLHFQGPILHVSLQYGQY